MIVQLVRLTGGCPHEVEGTGFDPVAHAHIVTTTTHETLRGPRGGLVLCQQR